ncbi:hypothetical protein DIPPA_07172 [Diplonema papillatum]|nr:hypothetical protein DIPPA_07172 [Diplonema papillatum]
MAYNNVSLDGIFVIDTPGEPARWVLGDFAMCCARDGEDLRNHSMALQGVVAPEDIFQIPREDMDRFRRRRSCGKPVVDLATRDVYGFACVIDRIILSNAEKGKDKGIEAPGGISEDMLALRDDILKEVIEKFDSSADVPITPMTPGDNTFEEQLADRGLEALLGELASAIEWVQQDALPKIPLICRRPSIHPLNVVEEVLIWALSAMHRSPPQRPLLSSLVEGRFLSDVPLVRAVQFLVEDRHTMVSHEERAEMYDVVLDCFDSCLYTDLVDLLVPLLCNRSVFVDEASDAVYVRLLQPRKSNDAPRHTSPVMQKHTEKDELYLFSEGDVVLADGLKNVAELNGCEGLVAGFDYEEGRVLVMFDEATSNQRALKPGNLTIVEKNMDTTKSPSPRMPTRGDITIATSGILCPGDYQKLVVPFLRSAVADRTDAQLRGAILRRAKYFVATFDNSAIMPEVANCLQDTSQPEALRIHACRAVPALLRSMAMAPLKQVTPLLTPLQKLALSSSKDHQPSPLRVAAATSLVSAWGTQATAVAVAACASCLHIPELAGPTVQAVQDLIIAGSIPCDEIVGIAVPLISPLTISPDKEVRGIARKTVAVAFAATAASGPPPGTSNTPRILPSAASFIASLPRSMLKK